MEAIEDQLADLALGRSYSNSTIQAYSGDLKRLLVYLSDHKKPAAEVRPKITGQDLVAFLDDEARQGFKSSTLQRRRVFVIQIAGKLQIEGALSEAEMAEVRQWAPDLWRDSYERGIAVLTEPEITRLFEVLAADTSPRGARNTAIVALMLETGLSVQQVMAVQVKDLNETMTKLVVAYPDGLVFYDTHASSIFLLQYLREGRPELVQSAQEPFFFISQLGGPISRQGVWQALKGLGKAAGLSQPLSPRTLRHTSVAQMIRRGFSVIEIQKLIGHKNVFSTRALVRKINRMNHAR